MANESVKESFLYLFDEALKNPVGLAIKTPNRGALRRLLYESKQGHPEYDDLVITLGPISQDELWILKKEYYGRGRPVQVHPEADNDNDLG